MRTFDAYPFLLPGMVVSVEAVLLSAFVLMKQNRMSQRVDQRDHLNVQLDLLAEEEITKMLGLQRAMCERLGIDSAERDPNAKEMAEALRSRGLQTSFGKNYRKNPRLKARL